MNRPYRLLLALTALILGIMLLGFTFTSHLPQSQLVAPAGQSLLINTTKVSIMVADTAPLRVRGLSGRDHLEENQGMLFVFDSPGIYPFWMKDMNFPLDMIWIDKDWRVVDIIHDVPPASFPGSFKSKTPIQYVLEINGGWSARHGIKVGDRVSRLPE